MLTSTLSLALHHHGPTSARGSWRFLLRADLLRLAVRRRLPLGVRALGRRTRRDLCGRHRVLGADADLGRTADRSRHGQAHTCCVAALLRGTCLLAGGTVHVLMSSVAFYFL
jgi:hypothetical protein